MATAIVNLLINNILSTEASLLWGVGDAIDDLKDELRSMKSLLIDANMKETESEREKTWVANVRDRVYDAEDIIDEFMYHINSQQFQGGCSSILHHTIYFPINLWFRYQTATKIQKINGIIKGAIPERKQRYGSDRTEGTSSKDTQKWVVQHAESSLFFKEEELVGIEKKRQSIMDWLMDGEPHQTVISIVGMAGSGKTALAASTYNNDDVKKHFDYCAWITISQAYELEDVLRSLIKEFHESGMETKPADLNSMNYRLLVKTLVNYLEKKRYLLVLDDVWDTNLLDEIKVSLQDSCIGSRIILTTRKEDVACYHLGGKHHVHYIQLLQYEEAWELFCKKAFTNCPNGRCPLELKSFAEELVGKCEGLPLAIASLGSLMYFKNMSQWNEIKSNVNWSPSNNPNLGVKSILLLSFSDLPYQLKHCFLYCSLFPEDHVIRRKRLIKLWMAEGFVEKVEGSTLEEVADSYLVKLTFSNMLQVVERNGFGRPKICKMHDLLRELALSISIEEKFGAVHGGGEEMKECKARRISIPKTDGELKSFMGMSKIRSFLVFNKTLRTLPSGSKMLRVLDLEDAPIDELPDEVFKLFNLRYLNLRRTLLKKLSNSIGKLLNLQTLDIGDTQIETLPRGIGKLQNLRHLITHRHTGNWNDFRYYIGMRAPSNIGQLKNLQTVSAIETTGDLLRQIQSLSQLTSIGIGNVKEADVTDLCISIQDMRLLRALGIMVTNEDETLRMDALSSPPPNLQKLYLTAKLEKVPQWFCSLKRLTKLQLHWSRLEEDVLPHIAALPLLGHLTLTNAYVGKKLCFITGFPKLTRMLICNFPQLNEIIIEEGVMPNLKFLYIDSCMELKTEPTGIKYLQNLQQLYLKSVSRELENCIRNVHFLKVQ